MKRGAIEHPKLEMLAIALGVSRAAAVGHFEALIHFAAKYSPRGDVGKWTDDVIAKRSLWDGDGGAFVAALIDVRILDRDAEHRLIVHDWSEHADDAVHKALKRRGETFADGFAPYGRDGRAAGSTDKAPIVDGGATTARRRRDSGATAARQEADSGTFATCLPEPEPEPVPESTTHTHGARRPIADAFEPDAIAAQLAADLRLDLAAEAADFRDHAMANARTSADPQADFRRWLRKSATMRRNSDAVRRSRASPPQRGASSSAENSRNIRTFLDDLGVSPEDQP